MYQRVHRRYCRLHRNNTVHRVLRGPEKRESNLRSLVACCSVCPEDAKLTRNETCAPPAAKRENNMRYYTHAF